MYITIFEPAHIKAKAKVKAKAKAKAKITKNQQFHELRTNENEKQEWKKMVFVIMMGKYLKSLHAYYQQFVIY